MADSSRSDDQARQGRNGHAGASATGARDTMSRPGWVFPLLALFLGLALGAGLMALLGGEDGAERGPVATSEPSGTTPSPTPTSPAAAGAVVVPASCLQIADEGQHLSSVLADGVAAAQDLDALRLSSVVRDVGSTQTRLQELARECRDGASATTELPTTPSPATSTTG